MNWAKLDEMTARDLLDAGWRRWNEPSDPIFAPETLMLIPARLYGEIPDGLKVIDIFGRTENFRRGVTDDDHRGGLLAYGVLRTE